MKKICKCTRALEFGDRHYSHRCKVCGYIKPFPFGHKASKRECLKKKYAPKDEIIRAIEHLDKIRILDPPRPEPQRPRRWRAMTIDEKEQWIFDSKTWAYHAITKWEEKILLPLTNRTIENKFNLVVHSINERYQKAIARIGSDICKQAHKSDFSLKDDCLHSIRKARTFREDHMGHCLIAKKSMCPFINEL